MAQIIPLGKGPVIVWHGAEMNRKVVRACERTTLALAETVASEAKQRVHRVTGTLSRSIHTFDEEFEGQGDERRAKDGEAIQGLRAVETKGGIITVLVGSLISYAKYEERLHPFMEPAFDVAMATGVARFRQAMAEEGLTV